jgi:acetoin utilization deacetylase AcuC-like enzyme
MTTPIPQTAVRPTALLRSPRFRDHDTGRHVENAHRLDAIDAELERQDLIANRPDLPFGPAELIDVEGVHNPWYVEAIERAAHQGGGWVDHDTYMCSDSYDVALLAAGASVAAVDAALDGTVKQSFALVRPPGHHATPERGMGFCLFNNIAIAAAHALARGLSRVLIVDWDVHHGNGTQDAFYDTDQVLFVSLHQYPFYPGTGAVNETGRGKGEGYTINLPLSAGQRDETYLRLLDERILPAARQFRPELILVSAGFDAHAHDPLGGMRLTEQGFAAIAQRLVDLAADHCDGRLVALLEGGYDPVALARSVAAVLRVLDGESREASGVRR